MPVVRLAGKAKVQDRTLRQGLALCAIIVAAVAFGGGGSRYGLANLLVQLTALGALAFHREAFTAFCASSPRSLMALIFASAALPLVYIVPLPPELWSAMPGRELAGQSFEVAGGEGWAPISLDPIRTLLAFTALIAPFAVLAIGWTASRDTLINIGWLVVALGLGNLLISVVQVLSNAETSLLYPENSMPGVLFGTFANRNSTGLFLVGALALAALLPLPRALAKAEMLIRLFICALLILAIVLTRSRTSLVLALLPIGAVILRLVFDRAKDGYNRGGSGRIGRWGVIAGVALTVGAVSTLFVAAPGRIGDVVERFNSDRDDARTYIWEDAAYSAQRYWPVGSGTGTFDDVFQVDESLENVTLRRAGRAHSDYLEVAIEAGAPGLVLVSAWLALLLWLSWRARTQKDRWIAWSGSLALLAIALQSVTDYPLRNQTLLAFGGFALLLLVRFSGIGQEAKR